MAGGRAPCCDRNKVKSGAWSPEEDARLAAFVQRHGHQNWRALPKLAGLSRCGKSCRLRWMNYLNPDVKHGNFTQEEEETIINLHNLHGNKWSTIAAELPGRTDNEIKNVFNTHLKKRLMEKAPEFHKDDKSQEAAMISNSSHSSPAGSNVSCEDQNVEKLPSDQDSATKKPRLLQSCPNNEPKEASSSNALNSSQVDAAARPSQEMNSQINSEGVKEVRDAVNEGQSQDNIDKVPFDPDLDFADWVEKNLESLPKERPLVDSGLTLYYMSKISGDENHPHDAGQSGYFEKIMEQAMDASFLDSPPPSPSGDIFKFE